jgi:hypothetical protein
MRVQFLFLVYFSILSASLAFAQGMSVSGILESYVSANSGAGEAPEASYGLQEYANIRMQTKIGDKAVLFGAVNLIAASGDYALGMVANSDAFATTKENYFAIIELERLYFKLKGKTVNFDGGLMRLPFGYSQVWGPSDFLNPKNPLLPYARPRAVLGGALAWYPTDSFKLLEFAVAGRDPFAQNGGITGFAAEQHWDMASLQMLYSFEFPDTVSKQEFHRTGMSVKADLELGFMLDMLYTYSKNMKRKKDGLSLSAGFDYSLFSGDLIMLTEYLYNGTTSTTSIAGGGSFLNENYIYTGLTWCFNDYTNTGAALISGLDDNSFVSVLSFSYDIFQGANLILRANIPISGEFGPLPPGREAGSYFNLEGRLQLKF